MLVVIAVLLFIGFLDVVKHLERIDKKLEKLQKTRKKNDS